MLGYNLCAQQSRAPLMRTAGWNQQAHPTNNFFRTLTLFKMKGGTCELIAAP